MNKMLENTTSVNGESAAVQSATAGPNAQDEPTAESGAAKTAEAAFENPAGGGSAPSLCSGLDSVRKAHFDISRILDPSKCPPNSMSSSSISKWWDERVKESENSR